MGRHINKRQRRRAIYATLAILGFVTIIWHPWSSNTPQTPSGAAYTPATAPQTILPSITPSSIPETPVTSGNVGIPLLSGNQGSSGTAVTSATTGPPIPSGTTTTTGPSIPPADAINYGAAVDPRFQQDPKNPLHVTYQMSASASILVSGGQFVPVASLPAGTLTLFSNLGQVCSVSIGGTVSSGTCSTTYPTFGKYNIVANYITGANTYVSPILTDSVKPFSTTTVAGISGGGDLGGLVFFAAVTDANGNPVTAGGVSLTFSDVTQGWTYTENGAFGPDGAHTEDFGCLVVENYPSIGKYSGCGESQSFVVVPQGGDTLTETATFSGILGWGGSASPQISYTMP